MRATALTSRRFKKDAVLAVFGGSALVCIGVVFVAIVGEMLWQGLTSLSWTYLVSAPSESGRGGGIGPIIVSTAAIVGISMAVTVPLGLATAIFLSELPRQHPRLARVLRQCIDVLAATPSIVIGLFGSVFFAVTLGFGLSILSGGLTLACMALPLFVRVAEAGLRTVPGNYRQAARALNLSWTGTLVHIVIPAALPTIGAGLALAIGRAAAETAALIFTSGYVDRMPSSWFDSGRALSVHIYDLAMNVPGGDQRAFAAALVLLLLVFIINLVAAATLTRLFGQAGK